MSTPSPQTVERFRRDTEALTGHPLSDEEKLLVAVSGGPDSLALLLLAHAAYGARTQAATVDHQLRPASADEARFVADLCASRSIAHRTLTGADNIVIASSVQARARGLRYLLLASWAASQQCRWLATGHHLDDQAETILMRLSRGSGLPGLASIRKRRREWAAWPPEPAVDVVRPLLRWRRETLHAVVRDAGLKPIDDPSNRSTDYDRTHFRDLLARTPLLRPDGLAASASHLADCEEALAWSLEREWDARVSVENYEQMHLDVSGLPGELRRRFAIRAIEELRFELGAIAEWRRDKVARLVSLLDAGRTATLAGIKCTGGAVWLFEPAPPRSRASA